MLFPKEPGDARNDGSISSRQREPELATAP
jgi:hypothetical protein